MIDPAPITNEAVKAYFVADRFGRLAVPTNASADLGAVCPTITIGQTAGAGHLNQLEVPEQVKAMIERFMVINGL